MIKLTVELNGKRVKPGSLKNELERMMLQQIINMVKKELKDIICSEHGERPQVTLKGKKLDNLSFEVTGCCQDLIDQASDKFDN